MNSTKSRGKEKSFTPDQLLKAVASALDIAAIQAPEEHIGGLTRSQRRWLELRESAETW